MDRPCTLTRWRVEVDRQAPFQEKLSQLESVLSRLPQPPQGLMLLGSSDDPAIFHTIGWFNCQADLEAMRAHGEARRLLNELVALSSECHPSSHSLLRADEQLSAARSVVADRRTDSGN